MSMRLSYLPGFRTEADASFRGSLAAAADEVRWGLPDEYERAVWETLVDQPVSAAITHAAAGAVGSSPHVCNGDLQYKFRSGAHRP
jgi:hypothetical protein